MIRKQELVTQTTKVSFSVVYDGNTKTLNLDKLPQIGYNIVVDSDGELMADIVLVNQDQFREAPLKLKRISVLSGWIEQPTLTNDFFKFVILDSEDYLTRVKQYQVVYVIWRQLEYHVTIPTDYDPFGPNYNLELI